MASVIEFSHDDYGPVWPMSIAPYQVQVCAIDPQKSGVGEAAEKLVAALEARGIEVLYDDRGEKAGSMFSDADLLGIPLRLVISPKTLAENEVEFRTRACRDSVRFKIDEVAEIIAGKVREELTKFDI
jgi:prolyl-tRNA synthetase